MHRRSTPIPLPLVFALIVLPLSAHPNHSATQRIDVELVPAAPAFAKPSGGGLREGKPA